GGAAFGRAVVAHVSLSGSERSKLSTSRVACPLREGNRRKGGDRLGVVARNRESVRTTAGRPRCRGRAQRTQTGTVGGNRRRAPRAWRTRHDGRRLDRRS